MIQLAVLDMAGTTVRDDGLVERAFVAALDNVGAPHDDATLDSVRAAMGQDKLTVFRRLLASRPDEDAQRANVAFEAELAAEIRRGAIVPIRGALQTIEALRAHHVRVCLTTGFAPATRDAIIDSLGWRGHIDLSLTPSEAGRGRPAPDMILTAVMRLGINAVQDVAVVGDTVSDLEAGTRAGASIVAGVLTGAHGRAELEAAPHTHILKSIVDLPAVLV